MSPSIFNNGRAYVFVVPGNGDHDSWSVSNASGVRPVINIKAEVKIVSGDGSASNPFVIAT